MAAGSTWSSSKSAWFRRHRACGKPPPVLVPDADGVDAVAFFFAADDDAAARAALQACASALPPYQRPRWWHALETLPRGPTGKLLRRKLRDLHLAMG